MLCALLQYYQSLLKSNSKRIELDSIYGCLIECVYRNKSLMTYAVVNTIIEFATSSQEMIFEELLVASINRGCHLSIIHDMAKLWTHSFSIPNENLMQAYMRILRNIRNDFDPNSGIYVYSILSLGLLDIDRNLVKELSDKVSNVKLDELLEHKKLAKYDSSFNRPYLNFLLSSEGNIETFVKGHKREYLLMTYGTLRPNGAVQKI